MVTTLLLTVLVHLATPYGIMTGSFGSSDLPRLVSLSNSSLTSDHIDSPISQWAPQRQDAVSFFVTLVSPRLVKYLGVLGVCEGVSWSLKALWKT